MSPPSYHEEDEDLDDLDDLIPTFTEPASNTSSTKPSLGAAPPSTSSTKPAEDDVSDEAFAAELAKGMESLLRELAGGDAPPISPSNLKADPKDVPQGEEADAIKDAWEKVFEQALKSSGADVDQTGSQKAKDVPGTAAESSDEFQKGIRETMERLKQSSEANKASSSEEDPLAALLASLGGLGGDGELDGDSMLESMMDGLMSKEVLYEPLKELNSKYPTFLSSPEASLISPEQLHVYRSQSELVSQIVKLFEKPGYQDEDEKMRGEVRELMGKMQDLGSPPKEVLGDIPEGFDFGSTGLPGMGGPDDCVIC